MNTNTTQFSPTSRTTSFTPNPRWNDFVCAVTTVFLLSLTCWANAPYTQPAAAHAETTQLFSSLSWINR
jgi:hypothetical protein